MGKGVQVPVGVGVAVFVAVGEGWTRRTLARASKPDGAQASTQWVPTVAQPAGTTTDFWNIPLASAWNGLARICSLASQANMMPLWPPGQTLPVTTRVTGCSPTASLGLTAMPGAGVGVTRAVGSWARAWAGIANMLTTSTHTMVTVRICTMDLLITLLPLQPQ